MLGRHGDVSSLCLPRNGRLWCWHYAHGYLWQCASLKCSSWCEFPIIALVADGRALPPTCPPAPWSLALRQCKPIPVLPSTPPSRIQFGLFGAGCSLGRGQANSIQDASRKPPRRPPFFLLSTSSPASNNISTPLPAQQNSQAEEEL